MPEGPEVTTITKGLSSLLVGSEIRDIKINDKSRYHSRAPEGYNSFMTDVRNPLISVRVTAISNKGKFIYWHFSNGWVMFQTLGMSGGWYHTAKPHSGICLEYLSSATAQNTDHLYFNDQRRFGTLKWIPPTDAKKALDKKLREIGPDMLNNPPSFPEFLASMQRPRNKARTINRVITDQKQISGVGNYLRSEILYTSRINPHRTIESLTKADIKSIYNATLEKIQASYRTGGASIQHYSDVDNKKGTFEFHMAVYKKKTDPNGRTVKMEKIAGDSQSTYWVPDYQV